MSSTLCGFLRNFRKISWGNFQFIMMKSKNPPTKSRRNAIRLVQGNPCTNCLGEYRESIICLRRECEAWI